MITELQNRLAEFGAKLLSKEYIIPVSAVLLTGFTVAAALHNVQRAVFVILVDVVVLLYLFWFYSKRFHLVDPDLPERVRQKVERVTSQLPYRHVLGNCVHTLLALGVFTYVIVQAASSKAQIVSVCGLLCLIVISTLLSKFPARIKWRPLMVGVYIQCILGLLVLKWPTGTVAVRWIIDQAVAFLSNTEKGTSFVYGFVPNPPNICGMEGPFAYTSLPVITFFGSLCAILYYYGIIQWVLIRIAFFLQYTMETTAAESLNAMASVVLGPTEAAVLVQMATRTMTQSEIVATMTAGYAMISGSLFAIYIGFGACPVYLIAANAMSAPAVLVVSKILYPETRRSKQKQMTKFPFPACEETSVLESLTNGANQTVRVIASIIANLIVYVALITMADTCTGWLGSLVGHPEVTFTKIMSWVFYPFAYMLGVTEDPQETMNVAKLIGLKTILNEFYAYQKMQEMLLKGELSPRAQLIAVFALCGYSNVSQIGSQIGIFGAMCPGRWRSFVKGATLSMVAGEIACFMTACIAGAIVNSPSGCQPSRAALNCLEI